MARPTIPPATRREAERLLKAGKHSHRAIAKRVKLSTGAVWNIADDLGLSGGKARKRAANRAKVHAEVEKGGNFQEIGRRLGMHPETVSGFARESAGDAAPPAPFPEAVSRPWTPFPIDTPGHWLVLGDVHVPCHDRTVIELAVRQAKRDGAVGVLLNGDILDCHELSDHDKDPSMPRYVEEVRLGRQFLAWLRAELPHARIVYKLGNHEERFARYVGRRAPAIEALEGFDIGGILKAREAGVEVVADKRVIRLGKLNVIHGHEYQGAGGVFPARWLWYKARGVTMAGHFHRTSNYFDAGITGAVEAAWTVGCACHKHPAYRPLNSWTHGAAVVTVDAGGSFEVRNYRVMDGALKL